MKKNLLIQILNLMFLAIGFAQSNFELNGIILDNLTKEPLEAVSVHLENTNVGTITNEEGKFKFFGSNKLNRVHFSHLGYETKIIDLTEIDFSNQLSVSLVPQEEILDEIILSSMPIPDLIKEILNTSKNHTKESYKLTSYNREILKTDSDYCFFADGLIDFYIEGKGKKFKSKSDLVKSRTIDGNCDMLHEFLKRNPFNYKVYEMVEKPFEKNRSLNNVLQLEHRYNFSLKTKYQSETTHINIIEFKPKNEETYGYIFEGYILYDVATNLILEYYIKKASNKMEDAFEIKSFVLTFNIIDIEKKYVYKLTSDTYILLYVKEYDNMYIRNIFATKYDKTFSFYSDLTTLNVVREKTEHKFKPYKGDFIFLNSNNFDQPFWKNTSITQSSEEMKFLDSIEK